MNHTMHATTLTNLKVLKYGTKGGYVGDYLTNLAFFFTLSVGAQFCISVVILQLFNFTLRLVM